MSADKSLFSFARQNEFIEKKIGVKRYRNLFLGFIILFHLIVFIVAQYKSVPTWQTSQYASGFSIDKAAPFLYFYYYEDLFPVTSTTFFEHFETPVRAYNDYGEFGKGLEYSKEHAEAIMRDQGGSLIMEYKHWVRMGENARMWAFLPDAILRGSPKNPSVKLFNMLIFTLALVSAFLAFYKERHYMMAGVLVIMFSFMPFFLYEVYSNTNTFALMGSVFLISLALNLKFIFRNSFKKYQWVLFPVLTGIVTGFSSEIRGETMVVLASAILIYILSNVRPVYFRIGLVILLVGTWSLTKKVIKGHFDAKFEQAAEIVKSKGGHVYMGKRQAGHVVWHTMFVGLSDFGDTTKVFGSTGEFRDRSGYVYALPSLREKYDKEFNYSGALHFDDYYDTDSLYYMKFEEFPEYDKILRDKIIDEVGGHPFWYIGKLFKRLFRILTITLPFPLAGWLIFPLGYVLIRKREWSWVKLIFVSTPLTLSSFLFYSGRFSTYNSMFPILLFLILVCLGIEWYLKRKNA